MAPGPTPEEHRISYLVLCTRSRVSPKHGALLRILYSPPSSLALRHNTSYQSHPSALRIQTFSPLNIAGISINTPPKTQCSTHTRSSHRENMVWQLCGASPVLSFSDLHCSGNYLTYSDSSGLLLHSAQNMAVQNSKGKISCLVGDFVLEAQFYGILT